MRDVQGSNASYVTAVQKCILLSMNSHAAVRPRGSMGATTIMIKAMRKTVRGPIISTPYDPVKVIYEHCPHGQLRARRPAAQHLGDVEHRLLNRRSHRSPPR